jgi:hypothetical protein
MVFQQIVMNRAICKRRFRTYRKLTKKVTKITYFHMFKHCCWQRYALTNCFEASYYNILGPYCITSIRNNKV